LNPSPNPNPNPSQVSLVDAKRANNIEITLARLRVPDARRTEALR
jgi:hypothetical protein